MKLEHEHNYTNIALGVEYYSTPQVKLSRKNTEQH